ncbi:MAG: DNA cytosine methyltransferase [Paracoccus sp. (in: a-proteobacteria)]|nr:DNA cytosine methyltransferase [Paracoccus sp. (in: a-proteobacteria)]
MGHVERETYAAVILVARMADAAMDQAPVWDDVATFDGQPWRGCVDILSAGYPCQPFSVAGKRRGADGQRMVGSAECVGMGRLKRKNSYEYAVDVDHWQIGIPCLQFCQDISDLV